MNDGETEDLEVSDLGKLVSLAQSLADENKEPFLVMTKKPREGYGTGCRLSYCIALSEAEAFHRTHATLKVDPR